MRFELGHIVLRLGKFYAKGNNWKNIFFGWSNKSSYTASKVQIKGLGILKLIID